MANQSVITEFWEFLKFRKRYWLLPIIIILGVFSLLIVLYGRERNSAIHLRAILIGFSKSVRINICEAAKLKTNIMYIEFFIKMQIFYIKILMSK